ncbi:unnamed protein product [Parascedosporium putredinis]|uniref:EF-hand domain-containing protein n=1 Tax=Parascedosporium putredinis TaxID=1442378 RepID=A0A9P1HB46_9PEZI|nr:unnamed protein product [Parascedosporium putredinis]CAI8003341.1 unnamed protein product [Parascedosporium putredinis]
MWPSLPSTDSFARPRLVAAAALSTIAVASASYYYFYSDASRFGHAGTGLHRSNAVRRARRGSRRSTPAPRESSPAPSTASTDEAAAEQNNQQEVEETVVDDDGQNGVDEWYNEAPTQRAGHNIVTLLFRVSEDNSRRNACVHRGCQCNSCSMAPIRGIRYRCATCADFDLCESQGARAPSILRQTQPVWYTGDPDSVHRILGRTLMAKLSRETGFERPELEAYWEQWTYMANTEWRDDPDELNLAMDRKTFERCLIPSGASQHMAPNLIHDRMFAFYDTNNDGLIGFTEFLHGVAFRNRRDKLERVFRSYDIDNDGYIDRKDCLRMFRAYYVLFKGMHKDVLDGLDEQAMASTEAQQLVASRQPLSSLFGRELTRMPPPTTTRIDSTARRQILNRIFINDAETAENTRRMTAPAQYAEGLFHPLSNISAVQALLSSLEEGTLTTDHLFTNSDLASATPPEGESPPNESQNDGQDMDSPQRHPLPCTATSSTMQTGNGEGEIHVSISASQQLQDRVEQDRSIRRRARRRLHERWRRRHFFLDEEEGARAPRGFDDSEDLLARAIEDLERAKEKQRASEAEAEAEEEGTVPSPTGGDALQRLGIVSGGGGQVGAMEIPEAERDAGKEILYQVAQQAFNDLLDVLFKEKETMTIQVAKSREDREKYAELIAAYEEESEEEEEEEPADLDIQSINEDSLVDVETEEEVAAAPAPVPVAEPVAEPKPEAQVEEVEQPDTAAGEEVAAAPATDVPDRADQTETTDAEAQVGEEQDANNEFVVDSPVEATESVEEWRDPTLPQFRPNSESDILTAATLKTLDEVEAKEGEDDARESKEAQAHEGGANGDDNHAHEHDHDGGNNDEVEVAAAATASAHEESPATVERRQRKEVEDKYNDTFANVMARWKQCAEAEEEALAREALANKSNAGVRGPIGRASQGRADCEAADVTPILVAPDGAEHACSVLESGKDAVGQRSSCDISYADMGSGQWTIVIQGEEFAASFQRRFELKSTAPEKTVVTVTPTVTVEITSTARAHTKTDTAWQTLTRSTQARPVTASCAQSTQMVTHYVAGPTEVVTTTFERWSDRDASTEYVRTTAIQSAYCHYPEGAQTPAPDETPEVPEPQPGDECGGDCQPWPQESEAIVPRHLVDRGVAAAAAITSTVYASETATSTSVITKAPRTVTETAHKKPPLVYSTKTENVEIAPETVCANQGVATLTTVIRGEPTTELHATYITHWATPVVTAL